MKNDPNKSIGLWLDHSIAHLIRFNEDDAVIETIHSGKESHIRNSGEESTGIRMGNYRSSNNEHHEHNRERDHAHAYYHLLKERLLAYDNILIFGSTTAKNELYNQLLEDKHFDMKSIQVKSTDHLTENQMVAEVRQFVHSTGDIAVE